MHNAERRWHMHCTMRSIGAGLTVPRCMQALEQLVDAVQGAASVAVLTGAGVSTGRPLPPPLPPPRIVPVPGSGPKQEAYLCHREALRLGTQT